MSEALPRSRWQAVRTTPLRDLFRGRVTARLDWPARLAAAGLPGDVSALVTRVVRRTRLWRLEKAAVADELMAHFADAIAAGAADPVAAFGDERAAAKLIRRAKRRGRPLVWHVWRWAWGVTAIVVAVYAGLMLRFVVGRPAVAVDYVAVINRPTLAAPAESRAWPLWRQALLGLTSWHGHEYRSLPAVFDDKQTDRRDPWPARADWLRHHAADLELARRAAAKPALGFVVGPGGSERDAALFPTYNDAPGDPLLQIVLPHLNLMREAATVLSDDARLAAEQGDGGRAEADVVAVLRLANQLRRSGPFLIGELVALGCDHKAIARAGAVLSEHPGMWTDGTLVRLAHAVGGPRVAADLVDLTDERRFFADLMQRVYTDDGHGDGRVTPAGVTLIPQYTEVTDRSALPVELLPFAVAPRAEVTARYDQMMDRSAALLAEPLRQANWKPIIDQIINWRRSPVARVRYAPLVPILPACNHLQAQAERYLGHRDGLVVAVALELFHRRHGRYPATLAELTPDLLPEVPADRITGDPVRYRLVDGKPVVYSVGADRTDDGGQLAKDAMRRVRPDAAADWGVPPADAPRGDWVLYPPTAGE